MGIALELLSLAILGDFYKWIVNPVLNSRFLGFASGIAILAMGTLILGVKIGQRPKPKAKGAAPYWSISWRRPPVPKDNRVAFWIQMPVMFAFGLGLGIFLWNGEIPSENFTALTYALFAFMIAFLIGVPSWFMSAEFLNIRDARHAMTDALSARKRSCLTALEKACQALEYVKSKDSKRVLLDTIRTQIRLLAFEKVKVKGRRRDLDLQWDSDIRDSLARYFELIKKDLNDSEDVAAYSEQLTYILQKGDTQAISNMRSILASPFDSSYTNFSFDNPLNRFWIFSAMAGLNDYDESTIIRLTDDALRDDNRLVAFRRSLEFDLLNELKKREITPILKIHLAKKINDLEGVDKPAAERAKQLASAI